MSTDPRFQSDQDAQKRRVQQRFGAVTQAYVHSEVHRTGRELDHLEALAAQLPQRHWALDVATGGGHTARQIAPLFEHLLVSDLTEPMLRAAASALRDAGHDPAAFVQADAEALPFATGTLDLVTCRIAPHHFPHPARFVREVARVLRPGGRFIVVDNVVPDDEAAAIWMNRVEQTRDPSHVRLLAVLQWLELLTDAKLTVIDHRLYRQRHEMGPWLDRMQATDAQRGAIAEAFQLATRTTRAAFRLEFDEGRHPLAFTAERMLVCADKPRQE